MTVFTGLIEAVGRIAAVEEEGGARTFAVEAPFADELVVGQSVAIDGACLTVTERNAGTFRVTAVTTTLEKTVAGRYAVGSAVNLERALRLGDRLDGHMVQGHVDGLAEYLGQESTPGRRILSFRLPDEVARVTIPQGSITLSGISLTVASLPEASVCRVAIIPHTWSHTNLSTLELGDPVNVEGDLIGRYVRRAMGAWDSVVVDRGSRDAS